MLRYRYLRGLYPYATVERSPAVVPQILLKSSCQGNRPVCAEMKWQGSRTVWPQWRSRAQVLLGLQGCLCQRRLSLPQAASATAAPGTSSSVRIQNNGCELAPRLRCLEHPNILADTDRAVLLNDVL